jgi:Tfp pilus assembly protein PilO
VEGATRAPKNRKEFSMDLKPYMEKISRFKHEFIYKHLRVDQIRDLLMKLSERDRKIVLFSALGLGIFLLLLIFSLITASLSNWENSIKKKVTNFDKIVALGNEYENLYGILNKIETNIKRTPEDFSLATHLESLSSNNGLKIDSMKPKPPTPNDYYAETQVEVKITGVALKTLVNFLYEIENSKEFLKVTSLQVRPSYSKPMYLDVTATISTFSPTKK